MLGSLLERLRKALSRGKAEEATWEEVEEALILSDMTLPTVEWLLGEIKKRRPNSEGLRGALKEALLELLSMGDHRLREGPQPPTVYLFCGANGTGKTTTIAKLAHRLKRKGRRALLSACDTFRAAAIEQVEEWGRRLGLPVVRQSYGADPAAVAYDAIESAKAKGMDFVLLDTAGRFHTKSDLMRELEKIHKAASKALGRNVDECLLVVDATTGKNAVVQAEEFSRAIPLTGLVLTKCDGTAKGGTVVSIIKELGLPVKLVGMGEGLDDLRDFDPEWFVELLLS